MGWREFAKQQNENLGIHVNLSVAMPQHSKSERIDGPINSFADVTTRRSYTAGEMNGLEKRYAAHLDLRKTVGEIKDWRFEAIKLRLATATFYSVDFLVWMIDCSIELHEVKGHWEDDARVKIKVAAHMFPEFQFIGVQWDKVAKYWKFEKIPK